jgi:hypothetical protein
MFSTTKIELIYIANSGICIRHKDRTVVIDGVHTKHLSPIIRFILKQSKKCF